MSDWPWSLSMLPVPSFQWLAGDGTSVLAVDFAGTQGFDLAARLFEARLIGRSSISPLLNQLQILSFRDAVCIQRLAEQARLDRSSNCVRPLNVVRSLTAIYLSRSSAAAGGSR